MPINRQDAQTLSTQIARDLRRRIIEEEFAVGEKFPSLRALAVEYEVAELTVHDAVKTLQHEGVLVSTSGRGTFVRAVPTTQDPNPFEELAGVRAALDGLREEVAALRKRVDALERGEQSA